MQYILGKVLLKAISPHRAKIVLDYKKARQLKRFSQVWVTSGG